MAMVLLLSGCVTRYDVTVDATAPGELRGEDHSYRIRNLGSASTKDRLRLVEAAQHVRTALSAHGWYEAVDPARAEMIIEIDFALGPPCTKVVKYDDPVFGHRFPAPGATSPQGEPDEVVGYEKESLSVVVREKVLTIAGYENPAANAAPRRELWRVQASINDEARDLRAYLPLLTAAAMNQIGQSSDGLKTVSLGPDSESVRFIRKGM